MKLMKAVQLSGFRILDSLRVVELEKPKPIRNDSYSDCLSPGYAAVCRDP